MLSVRPRANPPGESFTRCDGSRSVNSSRHAGYGADSFTVTVLPPPDDSTSSINPYPAGSTTPGWLIICCHR
jgi:hypothetical protein